jgi:acetyl esterase/lipase
VRRNSEDVLFDGPPPTADARLVYGPEPKQFGDLRLPSGEGTWPLAVVIHGGAWKAMYNLIHTGHMCIALGEAGIATWNVEYGAVGDVGGGWPGTGDDVARAVEYVDELLGRFPLDGERVALVGHSAGGQLALWAAKSAQLPVVSLAGVSDLRDSAERIGAGGAAATFMGGMPDELPERYAEGSPRELLPLGVRQFLVHGTEDPEVPYEMSVSYAGAAGEAAEVITLEGAGHFELIDPQAREWPQVVEVTRRALRL